MMYVMVDKQLARSAGDDAEPRPESVGSAKIWPKRRLDFETKIWSFLEQYSEIININSLSMFYFF